MARDIELLSTESLPVWLFPDHETLPYDPFSPHPEIIADRLKTLASLAAARQGILLSPVSSLIQRLPPADYILQRSFDLSAGQALSIEEFRRRLNHAGYEAAEQVYQAGQYAIRGSVIDLYPSGSATPYRLDLFDEEIESIKVFDPETQLSIEARASVRLLPAREFPMDTAAIRLFRQRYRATFEGDPQASSIYRDISEGIVPGGIEYYLPLFFEATETLFDYLPEDSTLVMLDGFDEAAAAFLEAAGERF